MGGGAIGKIIYFWIFILGILFMSKVLGFSEEKGTMVIVLITGTLVYIGWQLIRFGRRKD